MVHIVCETGNFSLVSRLFGEGFSFTKPNMHGYLPFELVKDSKVASFLVEREVQAPKLTELNLSKQKITMLPENEGYWKTFESLTSLDLSNNQLSIVPISLLQAPKLKHVTLINNPLEDIPSAYKKKDILWKDIQAYLHTLKENSTRWNEQKIFVIGKSGSGS